MTTRNYEVKFQIYGKAMRAIVMAKHEDDARHQIIQRVKFDSIEPVKEDTFNEVMTMMDGFEALLRWGELAKTNPNFDKENKADIERINQQIGPEKLMRLKLFIAGFKDIITSES